MKNDFSYKDLEYIIKTSTSNLWRKIYSRFMQGEKKYCYFWKLNLLKCIPLFVNPWLFHFSSVSLRVLVKIKLRLLIEVPDIPWEFQWFNSPPTLINEWSVSDGNCSPTHTRTSRTCTWPAQCCLPPTF